VRCTAGNKKFRFHHEGHEEHEELGSRGGFETRPSGEEIMAKLKVGDQFPTAKLQDIDGATVEFPAVFSQAPAMVVFFYRGRW
jgi:hypothetical protein